MTLNNVEITSNGHIRLSAPPLFFFGGGKGLFSLYWLNLSSDSEVVSELVSLFSAPAAH